MNRYYDVTAKITKNSTVFPGDPSFEMENVCHPGNNDYFELNKFTMNNHLGTHIDFPGHIVKKGKKSSDYSLDQLIGNGIIIEVPDEAQTIQVHHIEAASESIAKNDFVFFKTSNSKIKKQGELQQKYVYLEPNTAEKLIDKGVNVVGIDYISVDQHENENLPVHQSLLSNEVLIVENLELENVPSGRCKIYIMPLNIPEMDGLPSRVRIEKQAP